CPRHYQRTQNFQIFRPITLIRLKLVVLYSEKDTERVIKVNAQLIFPSHLRFYSRCVLNEQSQKGYPLETNLESSGAISSRMNARTRRNAFAGNGSTTLCKMWFCLRPCAGGKSSLRAIEFRPLACGTARPH